MLSAIIGMVLLAGHFVAVSLVSAIEYPPNPPFIGSHEAFGSRAPLLFLMLLFPINGRVMALAPGKCASSQSWIAENHRWRGPIVGHRDHRLRDADAWRLWSTI